MPCHASPCFTPPHPHLNSPFAKQMTSHFLCEHETTLRETLICIDSFYKMCNEYPNIAKCAILPMGPACSAPPISIQRIPIIPYHNLERVHGIFLSPSESTKTMWSQILYACHKKVEVPSPYYLLTSCHYK